MNLEQALRGALRAQALGQFRESSLRTYVTQAQISRATLLGKALTTDSAIVFALEAGEVERWTLARGDVQRAVKAGDDVTALCRAMQVSQRTHPDTFDAGFEQFLTTLEAKNY